MSKNKVKSEAEEPMDGVENTVEQTTQDTQNEATSAEEATAADTDLQGQLQQERDKYLRLYSEFENFRRRTTKDRLDWMQTASKDVLVNMLPVVDDFERALKAAENLSETEKKAVEGFDLIHKKLQVGHLHPQQAPCCSSDLRSHTEINSGCFCSCKFGKRIGGRSLF